MKQEFLKSDLTFISKNSTVAGFTIDLNPELRVCSAINMQTVGFESQPKALNAVVRSQIVKFVTPQLPPLWIHLQRWLSPNSESFGSASSLPFYTFSKLLLASEK